MKSDTHLILKNTKQILLGEESMKPEFKPLLDWVNETYEVETVNIAYELVKSSLSEKDIKSRLTICFKYTKDFEKFNAKGGLFPDFEKAAAIGEKFKEILIAQGLNQEDVLSEPYNTPESAKYIRDYVWVIFNNFQSEAMDGVIESIPAAKIDAFLNEIDNNDIWKVSRFYGGTTIFLHTDEQLKKYKNSEEHQKWTDLYFELVKEFDLFGYFKRESFSIKLDSKEAFDRIDEGNLYSYYK